MQKIFPFPSLFMPWYGLERPDKEDARYFQVHTMVVDCQSEYGKDTPNWNQNLLLQCSGIQIGE